MEKEGQTRMVHEQRFRERKRFAHKTSQTLSQRVIPALQHALFPQFPFPQLCAARAANDRLLGLPTIGGAVSSTGGGGNGLPQATTRLFAAISHRVSDNLPSLAAERYPDPGLLRLLDHKGPEVIQFQHHRLCIVGIRLSQRFAEALAVWWLFFLQAITQGREPPNVLSSPRKLLRSS